MVHHHGPEGMLDAAAFRIGGFRVQALARRFSSIDMSRLKLEL